MELTVNEAAPLVGKSPRAVRTWIAAGRLPARKTERGWLVRTADLPLTETQREHLQRRADRVRDAVESALPSRAAATRKPRCRSLLDLDVFHSPESSRGLYDTPGARRHARLGDDWPPRGQGLPMGAVTSQLLAAHVYLQALDHLAMRQWKVGGYLRYVDDFFLFADRRSDLRRWRREIAEWLWSERRLRLKHPFARVLSCRAHLDGLGWRIRREGLEPLPAMLRRLRARVGAFMHGATSGTVLERSMQATLGQAFVM